MPQHLHSSTAPPLHLHQPVAAPGYHGHGLDIGTLRSGSTREAELQQLQEENSQLRQEVQHLQQLLAVWQQQPCPRCQHSTPTGTKGKAATVGSASLASTAHAAVDRILRQQQVLIAQQQRQLLVLQTELSCQEQVVLEAEAVLAETGRRIEALADWASSQQQQQHQPQAQQPVLQRTAANPQRAAAAPTTKVLEHSRSLLAFCQEADARLARAKAAAAAQCRGSQLRSCNSNGSRTAGSTGGSKQQWQSPQICSAGPGQASEGRQQQLDLPYLPAGGNAFLQPGASLTLPALAAGAGLSAVAAAPFQQLMQQLACLAGPLAAFAVQLRSMILPALPWLQADQLAPELLNSCTQLAHQAATAAVQLSQLCALLPAAHSTLARPAVHAARKARAQQAAAAAEAGSWSTLGSDTTQQQQQQQPPQQLQPQQQLQPGADPPTAAAGTSPDLSNASALVCLDSEDEQLLQDIASLVMHHTSSSSVSVGPAAQAGQPRDRHTASSRCPGRSPAPATTAATPAAAVVLQELRQRLHVLGFKQGVLHGQLSFLARCSAAQAKLMTRLASDVLQALTDAAEATKSSALQQRRSKALQLCSQLQRAAALATQQQQQQQAGLSGGSVLGSMEHSGSNGALGRSSSGNSSVVSSSAPRAVLALLDGNREVLDDMPKLLAAASPGALKRAATSAVVAALSDFRAALQP